MCVHLREVSIIYDSVSVKREFQLYCRYCQCNALYLMTFMKLSRFSWRELTRFLERALSVIALGSSLKSSDEGRVSNRNNRRTSAATLNKQISNQTISTETQTSTGNTCN